MSIVIERAKLCDLADILKLLRETGLPLAGAKESLDHAWVAKENSKIVAFAALEMYGRSALLRSVAVDAACRGTGLGTSITQKALNLARVQGLCNVFLLTETAKDFFSKFGFEVIERSSVDSSVLASFEFTTLCPESALAMALKIAQ